LPQRGIGEQLVQWAIAEARARGCKLVELLTHHTASTRSGSTSGSGFSRAMSE